MKVFELIDFLRQQPQNIPVAYYRWSEQCMLEAKEINLCALGAARPDGWIQNARPDKDTELYLVFPGN